MISFKSLISALIIITTLGLQFGCAIHHDQYKHPITSQLVRVRGGQLEYYRFGQGSPIVLIPGYMTDISNWNRQFLSQLATQHEVIIFNNRNVGRSMVASSSYEISDLADDTAQLIDQLSLDKPTVLGLSMGGMIAQQLAVSHPNKIGKLILMNTAISGHQAIHPSAETERAMSTMPINKLGRYLVAIELFAPSANRLSMSYQLVADRFLPSDYLEIEPSKVKTEQRALVQHWVLNDDPAKQLEHIKIPTLVLSGGADTVIPPQNSQLLFKIIPHAHLARWKNGGHGMMYQYPHAIANEINDFIAS